MYRSLLTYSLLAAMMLLSWLVPQPAQAQSAVVKVRIGVTADNLYRIIPADLTAAGVNVANVDPRTFKLTSLGSDVPVYVTGDSDGRFNGTDELQFFGQRYRGATGEDKYTDERVYWLEIGGTAGPRIADLGAAPLNNLPPPADFKATVHNEPNMWYWNLESTNRGDDTWFGDRFRNIATTTSRSYAYNTPYPAPGADATLRVEMLARKLYAPYTPAPNHQVRVAVVESDNVTWTTLTQELWNDLNRRLITTAVPAGKVLNPSTVFGIEVQVPNPLPAPTAAEDMYFNYWELEYRRLFRAVSNQIDFKAETASTVEYEISDFTTNQVAVWDVTTPGQPVRRTGASAVLAGATYTVRFRVTPTVGTHYWLKPEGSFATPASISVRTATGLLYPTGGADTVIVTPNYHDLDLGPAAETLANWHRVHGRRTVIADLQDVYDEFNDGIRQPIAIQKMMIWAASNWDAPAPAYLVLMGDGHFNPKGFNPALYTNAKSLIPPYLAIVDPWVGEIPSDGVLGDITGPMGVQDNVPDVAVGRLPVNTLAEANTVVNKIISYEENVRSQDWQRQAVFVAGPLDPAAGDFPAISDEIIQNHLAPDLTAQRIYIGTTTLPPGKTYTNLLVDAINSGALMVQWAGHGNVNVWKDIWATSNTALLTNSARLPVFATFNCLDGYYISPLSTSVAETMLRRSAGGSVAAISPSGDGLVYDQTPFRKILMDTLFRDDVREVGRALTITKQDYAYDAGGKYPDIEYGTPRSVNYLVYQMNLFGDPALRLPAPAEPLAPAAAIARTGTNGSQVKLSWPAVTQNIVGANTTVTTYGIWRSTKPYFDPDAATKVADTANLYWVDDGTVGPITPIGDVANNYFYVVRAQNGGGWSAASKRTGEFDSALRPGS